MSILKALEAAEKELRGVPEVASVHRQVVEAIVAQTLSPAVTSGSVRKLIEKIESCDFECAAGPLSMSDDWAALKAATDLYVVVREGQVSVSQHTSGKGGWRFIVHTNGAEAQATADSWNRSDGPQFNVRRL